MKVSKADLNHSRNMLKVLGKGEWKLDGMEILAFAEMMKWFSGIQRAIETEVAQEEAAEKAKVAELEKLKNSPIIPQEVVSPIQSIDGPLTISKASKKSKKGK